MSSGQELGVSRKSVAAFLRDFKAGVQLTVDGAPEDLDLSPSLDEAVAELGAFFSGSDAAEIIRGATINYDKYRKVIGPYSQKNVNFFTAPLILVYSLGV